MEKMGIIKKNVESNSEVKVEKDLKVKFNVVMDGDINMDLEINKRKIFMNKFIEKFPKANLHTLTQINKFYNSNSNKNNIDLNKNKNIDHNNNFTDETIYKYLSVLN